MTKANEMIDDKTNAILSDNNDCPSSDEIRNEVKETSSLSIKKKPKPRDPNKRRKIRFVFSSFYVFWHFYFNIK